MSGMSMKGGIVLPLHGYMGKMLFINLTDFSYHEEFPDESFYREYIGGYGLGVRVLYERMKPGIDPLGPENILGLCVGPFVGTKAHGAGRLSVVCKSPLTGGWADSSCGGSFGMKMKKAGYDAIFISGISETPVYIYINDGNIEFKPAAALWGKDSSDTEDALKTEFGRDSAIITIGQAGENLSRISAIMHDYGRAAARLGVGAVMGSKKLKAVVVKGTNNVSIADRELFEQQFAIMKDQATVDRTGMFERLGKYGSAVVAVKNTIIQDAPCQNWKGVHAKLFPREKAEKLGPEEYLKFVKRKYACSQCALACGAYLEITDSRTGKKYLTHRPEYETIAGFGSNCLVDDIETVIMANEMCNRYGFDTISASATIAFAMECHENGLITDEDTGKIRLEWGNKDAILPMLEMMSKREGIGAVFADGVKIASEKIGKGSEEFAMHIAGEEPSNHDPRCWPGFGYGYVLDPKLGHHTSGGVGFVEHGWTTKEMDNREFEHLVPEKYNYDNKGKPLAKLNKWFQFFYACGMCLYTYFGYKHYPVIDTLRAITGWYDFDLDEALKCGERINTLRQCFALREGLDMRHITLPKRLLGIPPFAEGPTAGVTIDMENVRRSYYKEAGWDAETAKPAAEKLEMLNLSSLVKDL
jgi:aldehyde:ferredoxin oxidoreductase